MTTYETTEANRDGDVSALAQLASEARDAYEAWEARRLALRAQNVHEAAERALYRFLCRQSRCWWERAEELDMQADAERGAAQRLAVADYALTLAPVPEDDQHDDERYAEYMADALREDGIVANERSMRYEADANGWEEISPLAGI